MEFNTTTGIWPKIKEYIDSKLSSTGGGVLRIIDHPFKNTKFYDVLNIISVGDGSYNAKYFAFAKKLNIVDWSGEILRTINNVFVFFADEYSGNNNYLFGYSPSSDITVSEIAGRLYNTLKNGTTETKFENLISFRNPSDQLVEDYLGNIVYIPLIDIKYPDEEQGTIYNSGDGRFWNNKMLYVTNTGNLIS